MREGKEAEERRGRGRGGKGEGRREGERWEEIPSATLRHNLPP